MPWVPAARTSATCSGNRWTRAPRPDPGRASETVWDSLISGMSDKALLQALRTLDIDDQIYLGQYLPSQPDGSAAHLHGPRPARPGAGR